MNTVKLPNFGELSRRDFLVFTSAYVLMTKEIISLLAVGKTIKLCLARITDQGMSFSKPTLFTVLAVSPSMFEVSYPDEGYEELRTKTIRLDNVLGEIPVLPGFKEVIFLDIGTFFENYKLFIAQVKIFFRHHEKECISLVYKNDDGSYSVIDGTIKKVNEGNYEMADSREILVRDNKTVRVDLLSQNKYHRFISENGFLCQVSLAHSPNISAVDDGEVFGEEVLWRFPQGKQVA